MTETTQQNANIPAPTNYWIDFLSYAFKENEYDEHKIVFVSEQEYQKLQVGDIIIGSNYWQDTFGTEVPRMKIVRVDKIVKKETRSLTFKTFNGDDSFQFTSVVNGFHDFSFLNLFHELRSYFAGELARHGNNGATIIRIPSWFNCRFDNSSYNPKEIYGQFISYIIKKIGVELNNSYTYILDESGEKIYLENANIEMLLEKYGYKIDIKNTEPLQKIYYGAPGTGKSHKINNNERVEIAKNYDRVFRTTFHPEMDYASFVGAYKPTMDAMDNIVYEFVPQVFMNAYLKAWKEYKEWENQLLDKEKTDEEKEKLNKVGANPVYLIIEEINRGNCAAIFGDLFQLLDRNENGMSQFPIVPNKDIELYIKNLDKKDFLNKSEEYKKQLQKIDETFLNKDFEIHKEI